jgi:hypothetical protein
MMPYEYPSTNSFDDGKGIDVTTPEEEDTGDIEVAHRSAIDDQENETTPKHKRPCILIAIIAFVVIAVFIPLLFVFDIVNNDDLKGVPGLEDVDFDTFFDQDPFGGRVSAGNPEDAYRWWNRGNGLELALLNALDQTWQSNYKTALFDWENGTPDPLTLSTRQVPHDVDCQPINGILKVCNGEYGINGWRGLNAIILDNRDFVIFASSAKMNDSYLKNDSEAHRQYTMCHEIGHGFGLPHWDENFYNRDLGNCMDYTATPRNNRKPDSSNFEFLAAMYGVVGSDPDPEDPNVERFPNRGGGGLRKLFGMGENTPKKPRPLPDWVIPAYNQAMVDLEAPASGGGRRHLWRKLHSNDYGEALEVELGDGFVVQAHKLLV